MAIDGMQLTVADVVAVVRDAMPVRLTAEGRARAVAAHETVVRAAERRPVYAQGTGVGSNKDALVDSAAAVDHGKRLLESHAVAAGPVVSAELARAMMVVRLNQLAAGGSGVNPRLLDVLADALNKGLTPELRKYGAIGTGDLTALATLALCISGDRPWSGGTMKEHPFGCEDAMAFMSSGAATLGEAVLACSDIADRLRAGLVVAAFTHLAVVGSAEAYDARVHKARPHSGQTEAASEIRRLLGVDLRRPARRIQDPYGLRALPQVHGAAFDAVVRLDGVLVLEMNASSENPFVSVAADDVFHNGNFHSVYVGQALDALCAAVYGAASLSVARLGSLMSSSHTGLRPFLADGPVASSGLLILEYIAHSALAELRHLANPDGLGGAVLSHGAEEHASFATQSAWHATESIQAYETILACELLSAVCALRQQGFAPNEEYLRDVHDRIAIELERNNPLDDVLVALTRLLRGIGANGAI